MTFIERLRKVEYMAFKDTRSGGFRLQPRTLSSTQQGAASGQADLLSARLPEALPCWTEDFVCLIADLALEILPCKMLRAPLPTVLSPGPADWYSETWVCYPPTLSCDVTTDFFSVISVVVRLVRTWIESALIKAEWIYILLSWVNTIVTCADSLLFLRAGVNCKTGVL